MKTKRETAIGMFLLMAAPALMLSSCSVNDDYSLSDLNTDVTVLQQISLPVGSTKFIPLSDLLKIKAGDGLQTDKDGNYIINYSLPDGASASFDIPGIEFKGLKVSVSDSFSDIPGAGLPVAISGRVDIGSFKKEGTALFDQTLPGDVKDIKSLSMSSDYDINFSSTTGTFYIAEGFKVTLPSLFRFSEVKNDNYSVKNGTILFLKDTKIENGSLKMPLKITGIDLSKAQIGNGKISCQTKFDVDGKLFIEGDDYRSIPSSFSFDVNAEMKNCKITEAEVKIDIEEKFAGSTVSIGDMPDFLDGADNNLGIENIAIILNVDNNSPIDLKINAGLASSKAGKKVGSCAIKDVVLPAGQKSVVRISSKNETSSEPGVICYYAPDLSSLISTIPDKFEISDIVAQNANEYNTVTLGSKGTISVGYDMTTSLAFSQGTHIGYSDSIKDINLNLESIGVKSLSLCFNIINSIPLDVNLGLAVIDAAGNVVPDIKASLSSPVKAGSLQSPATSSEVLTLSSSSAIKKIDGFKISVTADVSSADIAGIAINEKQGIQLSDIVVKIDGGVTIEK